MRAQRMDRALAVSSYRKSQDGEVSFDFGVLFVNKTALGSPSGDGSQQAGANTAIDSFWLRNLLRYDRFVVHRSPWGHMGVPWGSQGRARGLSGTSGTFSGGRRGVPWGPIGVPGASPGVPGTCPGDIWDPRGLRGRPGHPQDSVRKNYSIIYFHNIIR